MTFAGWLASPAQYLPTVDVFALPSRSEGSPLALAEAMLAELPCVATSVGSVPEAITTEHDGLLVPKDDPGALAAALTRLRDDAALRARLGAAARVSALARSTAATMTAAYEQVWAAVVARPRAPRLHPPPPRP